MHTTWMLTQTNGLEPEIKWSIAVNAKLSREDSTLSTPTEDIVLPKTNLGVNVCSVKKIQKTGPARFATTAASGIQKKRSPIQESLTKTCKACGLDKHVSEFYTRRDGTRTTHQARCMPCHNKMNSDYQKARRRRWREASTLAKGPKPR